MSYRNRASKPCVALWMLMALLLVAAGIPTMIALLGAITATLVVLSGWLLVRRGGLARTETSAAPLPARRRA
ncbi:MULTISPECIES: hypothetical protein [Micromonospora]|uniref:Uncharacterized protein n=1 Tax=Micromonospora yangpuensis TaxID=683228 RepID=A0A1C6U617_9ACTN|nr:hypothetical protein [Micromonospora yangpuensis]GGL91014.1 hypothetical protein GCM10012279_06050 [Micromonospora yangpuensis]SCL49535.1 hypothetical protein GA0070617_1211 [Micromonospora yangpuensis]